MRRHGIKSMARWVLFFIALFLFFSPSAPYSDSTQHFGAPLPDTVKPIPYLVWIIATDLNAMLSWGGGVYDGKEVVTSRHVVDLVFVKKEGRKLLIYEINIVDSERQRLLVSKLARHKDFKCENSYCSYKLSPSEFNPKPLHPFSENETIVVIGSAPLEGAAYIPIPKEAILATSILFAIDISAIPATLFPYLHLGFGSSGSGLYSYNPVTRRWTVKGLLWGLTKHSGTLDGREHRYIIFTKILVKE